MLKRLFDLSFSFFLLLILALPMALIACLIRLTSRGPAIHWSKRIGRGNEVFLMPKFRSMHVGAPQVATHLLSDSASHVTPLGAILRKTSLDELPQLWSVLNGDMSIVGPRPALFNQDDLVAIRTQLGVDRLRPGITGWAQVNGRDDLPIAIKAEFDKEYLEKCSVLFDFKILAMTLIKVLRKDGVSH